MAPHATLAPDAEEVAALLEARHSDLGNATRLDEWHGQDLRKTRALGWLTWTGKRWEVSEAEARRKAHETARRLNGEAAERWREAVELAGGEEEAQRILHGSELGEGDLKLKRELVAAKAILAWAGKSQDMRRLSSMLTEAGVYESIAAEPDAFDVDEFLVNCGNGTIDLRTGKLSPHRREDLITRILAIDYDAEAKAPRWEVFVSGIMGGDGEMVAYLQRAFGLALSGCTGEQAWHFAHGIGANGK